MLFRSVASLLEVAATHNVVTRNGSFFVYGSKKLGNGVANATSTLRVEPALCKEIKDKTYEIAFGNRPRVEAVEEEEDSFDESEEVEGA